MVNDLWVSWEEKEMCEYGSNSNSHAPISIYLGDAIIYIINQSVVPK
jgi:hypothetical protein